MGRRVPGPHELVRTRECTACHRTLPWIEFSPNSYAPDGSVASVKSQCYECRLEITRDRRIALGRELQNGRARIPAPSEWIRTKHCPHCGETKPWAKYSPREYWPDGSVRRVQAWCRDCKNELNRGSKREPTDEERRYKARWGFERRAEMRRERAGYGSSVPMAPLVPWLLEIQEQEGSLRKLAEDAGLHHDTLTAKLRRSSSIAETTAEAVLCARGLRMDDIYQLEDAA